MLAAAAVRARLDLPPAPAPGKISDAGRLLALGRALGQLGRVTSEDPDFQVKAQDSRDALAAAFDQGR